MATEHILGNEKQKTVSPSGSDGGKESITPLKGTVISELKRCGRPACRCTSGHLHGPYSYRMYRERGRLRKEYVRPTELERVRDGIEMRRRMEAERREVRRQLRLLLAALKGAGLWGS